MLINVSFSSTLLCLLLATCFSIGGPVAQGDYVIADFEGGSPLSGMVPDPGVTIASTTEGVTSGTKALEITLATRESSTTNWAQATLSLSGNVDASNYTRLSFDVTNPHIDDAYVQTNMMVYSPGAGPGWGYAGAGGYLPSEATETISFDLIALSRDYFGTAPIVDVSELSTIGVGGNRRPYEEVVMYFDNVRLEYDPGVGSPTTSLRDEAQQLRTLYLTILNNTSWDGVDPARQLELTTLANGLIADLDVILAACNAAEAGTGFGGTFDEVYADFMVIRNENQMGQFFLLHKPAFYTWTISPYVNIFKEEYPAADSTQLTQIDVSMAQGEYRDTVFMISANAGGSQSIDVSFETGDPPLQNPNSVLVQESLYVINYGGKVVSGGNYELTGPLVIPEGESRQIRIRFSAKAGALTPGQYSFNVRLTDSANAYEELIPGTLEVWDFELPDAALFMWNNTYCQFSQTSMPDLTDLMVKDMKEYGLNMFTAHPFDISVDVGGGYHEFSLTLLDEYVGTVMQNWGGGPPPRFLFSLGYGISPGGVTFGPWVDAFNAVMESYGFTWDDWAFVYGDEAKEWGQVTTDLSLHINAKRFAPNARLFSNSSAMISDPELRALFYENIDHLEPELWHVNQNPYLRDYLRTNAPDKVVALYGARGTWTERGANLYNYYRVYGWEAFREDCIGMGLWTYANDWGSDPWTVSENPYVLVYRHPTERALVHSRRYEAFREGIDDYRYLYKLREVIQGRSAQEQADAEALMQTAIADITSNNTDYSKCETWRIQVALEILKGPTSVCGDLMHGYPVGDLNNDCRVNVLDIGILAGHWMACTHSLCSN